MLATLESGEQADALSHLADDLPLFAARPVPAAAKLAEPSAVEEALRAVNPDELTPKAALELLYELRRRLDEA